MDYQSPSSRAELIRQARENCSRNLSYTSSRGKEKEIDSVIDFDQPLSFPAKKKIARKIGVIRWMIVIVFFLSFIAIDQLDLKYEGINSHWVANFLQGEKTLTKIKQEAFIFTKEKIIPVFHRLEE